MTSGYVPSTEERETRARLNAWLAIGLPVIFRYKDREMHNDGWLPWSLGFIEPNFGKLFEVFEFRIRK